MKKSLLLALLLNLIAFMLYVVCRNEIDVDTNHIDKTGISDLMSTVSLEGIYNCVIFCI